MYKNQHNKEMTTQSIAQLASTILYGKRMFPYYTFNIIGGLDEEGNLSLNIFILNFYQSNLGKGAVYSFDPVGSFEREVYRAGGSAASLIQPLLDSQIGKKNRTDSQSIPEYSLEEAVQITKDAFTSAAERDIYTGDFVEIWKITSSGLETELFPLRKD
jgi:20S proteasome subunit beta 6